MKPLRCLYLTLILLSAILSTAFNVPPRNIQRASQQTLLQSEGNLVRGLEITAITQWHYETSTDRGHVFRTAVFKDVHVGWDRYLGMRGYFDAKAMGVGTGFITREAAEVKLPGSGNWPVLWTAYGTVSPEGAIDMRLALYDLQGLDYAEVSYGGMVLASGTEIKPAESYKMMSVHLEPYETYKAVPAGMGGTLEFFVFRSNLIPVSALVPDVDPTELEWGLGKITEITTNVIDGKFDVISDVVELHVEEWTEGWKSPW